MMNDQFIPAPAQQVITAPVEMSPEVQAAVQHARAVGSQKFQQLFQVVALWEQSMKVIVDIVTQEEHDAAIKSFDNVKKAIKAAERFRLDLVSVPTKYTRLVNETFRPLLSRLESVKQHYGTMLARKQNQIEAEHRKAAEEARKVADSSQPAVEVVTGEGEGKVDLVAAPPAPPPTTIKTTGGAKASFRETIKMEIKDPIKLLKAIVSPGQRNEIYTVELVSFNEPAIKKLCLGKRRIPGVEWKKEKIAV